MGISFNTLDIILQAYPLYKFNYTNRIESAAAPFRQNGHAIQMSLSLCQNHLLQRCLISTTPAQWSPKTLHNSPRFREDTVGV